MVTGSPLLSAIFAGFLQYVEAILLTAVKWRTCGVVCLCRFSHSTSPAWDAVPVAMLLPTQHLGSFETFKPTDHDNVSNPLRGGNSFMGPKVMTLWPLKCLDLTWSLGILRWVIPVVLSRTSMWRKSYFYSHKTQLNIKLSLLQYYNNMFRHKLSAIFRLYMKPI